MAEKTTGQWVGTIVGAIVGYFTAGVGWAATASSMASGAAIGGTVGSIIDPPRGPQLFGPRLNDLSQQGASYGAPIPSIYGSAPVFGNVFWIENNALRESSHTEGGGKGGGGGAETTTYSYSATFALGLCRGPIAGIRRIWISGNLIYEAAATDVDTIAANNAAAQGFTVYLGTETQQPDPRMQAALGVANTPAFRGLAYIVFNDLELADYGNTLIGAQIKVEVVISGNYSGWARTTTVTDSGINFETKPRPYITSVSGEVCVGGLGVTKEYVFSRNGQFLATRQATVPPSSSPQTFGINNWFPGGKIPIGVYEEDLWVLPGNFPSDTSVLARGIGSPIQNLSGNIPQDRQIIGLILSNSRQQILVISGDIGIAASGGSNQNSAVWTLIDRYGNLLESGNVIGTVSIQSFGFNRAVSYHFASSCFDQDTGLVVSAYGAGSGTVTIYSFNVANELVVQSIQNLSYFNFTHPSVYTENGVIFVVSGSHFNVFTRGLISQSFPSLAQVVSAECMKSSLLTAGDLDVTSLTDSVLGYRISSNGAIRSGLEPLQGVWPFDVIQSGYKIKFRRRRGLSSIATILISELGARSAGDKSTTQLTQAREMDTQLPGRVIVSHLDSGREYDVGEQDAERLNTGSINERRVELAIVLSATDAKRVAENLLDMYWLERYDFSFSLPPTYRGLEPSDVVTVVSSDASYALRLTSIQYHPDGSLECSAKLHDTVYASTAIGIDGVPSVGTVPAYGMSNLELLDIPTLSDGLDGAGYLIAACGYSSSWPGMTLFRSSDGGVSWVSSNVFTRPSTIGYCGTAIAAPADTRMMDKSSLLGVMLYGGATLSSISELQMLNGQNHFAYGVDGRWEIIAAQNAVLQGDGSYVLSDLLRGRFGTEWAAGLHQANDKLILLSIQKLQRANDSLNNIGRTLDFKAVTLKSRLSETDAISFTYAGQNLECLSPVSLNGNRHPTTSDWTLTWLRRTRIGGEWRDYVDASLGESSEAYEVEIYTTAAYTTLKRTISGLSSTTCTYTSAQQVADFGSNQATLYIKVYQLSANVGRGQPLTTSITR